MAFVAFGTRIASGVDTAYRVRMLDGLTVAVGDLLKGRSGVRSPLDGVVDVNGGSMQVRVYPYQAWVQGSADGQGGYMVCADDTTLQSLDAGDATGDRIDLIVVRVYDDAIDGSGRSEGVTEVVKGDPATGVAPAVPPSSIPLREILVPAGTSAGTGGLSNQDVGADRRSYTGGLGGLVPVNDGGDRATLLPYDGMPIWRLDLHQIEVYDGNTWQPVAQSQPPRCRVKRNGDQTIPTDTDTTLNWQAADYDQGNLWGSGSDITVPQDGVYAITASVQWQGGAGNKAAGIVVNGVAIAWGNVFSAGDATNEYNNSLTHRTLPLQAGDVVTVHVKQNTGGPLDAQASQSSGVFCEVVCLGR